MGTGPRRTRGLRPRADRGARRRRAPLRRRGRQRRAAPRCWPSSAAREADAGRDAARADAVAERAAAQMGREIDAGDIQELLYRNREHPRWDEVADRCLTCGNCTMVCPTCFCTTVEDVTDLAGEEAERNRRWDSCFTLDHSYVHGGSVRPSTRSRYRQWMTHKLATWIDQFGTSGCVGCGRCITWCPVAIDITEEVAAIRATPANGGTAMRTLDELLADAADRSPGWRRAPRADRGLRAATASSRPASFLLREGEPADALLRRPRAARSRSRSTCRTRRDHDRDAARRRRGRLVVAVPALPLAVRRARASGRRHAIEFDGACLRGKCEADPVLGYELMQAVRRRHRRAPAGHAAAAARRLWHPSPALRRPSRPRRDGAAALPRRGAAPGDRTTRGRWSSSPRTRRARARFAPGQFAMLYAFGVGEVPISVSGDPSAGRSCTRSGPSGRSRARSAPPQPGDVLGVRGPFGTRLAGRPRPRAPTSWSSPAASAWRRCARRSTTCSRTASATAGSSLLYGGRSPDRAAVPRRARGVARPLRRRGRGDGRRRRRAAGAGASAS